MPATFDKPTHIAEVTRLDPARFHIQHDIPLFDEHDAEEPLVSDDGRPETDENGKIKTRVVRYSRDVLEAMCRNMNARIRDTGDYTAICITHTPTPREKMSGVKQPSVVGFAGPFYVNKIGMAKPRWCIFAQDWAIYNNQLDNVRGYPRRSVEVWRRENPKDRYFDPIALLGGETPARDLGLNYYSRGALGNYFSLAGNDGAHAFDYRVARYSMAGTASYPSGTNTFIPGGDAHKRRHADQEPPAVDSTGSQTGEHSMLSEDEISQIVEAVSQLAPFQWAEQQMSSEQAKTPGTEVPPEAGAAPGGPDMGAAPPDAGAPPSGAGSPPPDATGGPPPFDKKDKNAIGEPPGKDVDGQGQGGTPKDRLAAAEADLQSEREASEQRALESQGNGHAAALAAENAELKTRLSRLEVESNLKTRYAQVEHLSAIMLGLDPRREYELAGQLGQEAWDARMDGIERMGQRNPTMLPELTIAEAVRGGNENTQEFQARVKSKAAQYANRGEKTTYEIVRNEVRKEMGLG